MSIQTNIEDLSYETRQKINKDLEIAIESKFGMGETRYIYPFEIDEDKIKLPFAYAARTLKLKQPDRKNYPTTNIKFEGTLRDEQKEVRKEAIKQLSKSGSILLSMYCGFGKCLGINTPILMFDGTIKMVQDVKSGELLMGDDSTSRQVLSIARGKEQMYNIISNKGDSFTCNESHILSLKISFHKVVIWNSFFSSYMVKWIDIYTMKNKTKTFKLKIDAENFRDTLNFPDVIDIDVKTYLSLPLSIKSRLLLYKVPVEFQEEEIDLDPYFLGLWLGKISSKLSITTKDEEIGNYLQIYAEKLGLKVKQHTNNNEFQTYNIISDSGKDNILFNILQKYKLIRNKHIPHIFKCNSRMNRLFLLAGLIDTNGYYYKNMYKIIQKNVVIANDIVYVAQSLGFSCFNSKTCINNENFYLVTIYGSCLDDIPVLLKDKKALPNKQVDNHLVSSFKILPIDDKDYYGFVIDGNHRFLLGDFTVTHNTCCSIKLACDIGFKTLVIVNKLVLMKQWEEGINRFCPNASVQILTTRSKKKDCDFYIMNAQNVEKMGKYFFSDVGSCIIDESHMIMAETLSRCLQYVYPRYLIGLTATPYRPDGLNILLDLYFGNYKIIRNLWREHTAYKVNTGFKPTIEYAKNGRVNWGIVLDSQANDDKRNEMIIKLLKHFSDRNFLVMVKRVSQGEYLIRRLKEEGEDVTSLIGSNQEFETSSRILIGTNSKIGVGFDHAKLDALLLASDVEEYFVQYLGRVFRTKEVEPIILDLVDNYSILNKHWNTRRKIYQDHGGKVKNFDINDLE